MTLLGSDFDRSGPDGLTPDMLLLEGERDEGTAFLQALIERLNTPRGAIFYDKNAGLDLRSYIADDEDPAVAAYEISQECLKDERCAKCPVNIIESGSSDSKRWDVTIRPVTEAGDEYELTFPLTLAGIGTITASQVKT